MKFEKSIYWIATFIMCAIFLFSAYNYFFNYEMIAGFYRYLGFPTWIIYPLAVLKVLGVIAILSKKSALLKEWAYAGFFYDAVLAFAAHYMAGDGAALFATIAIISTVVSRLMEDRI